MEQLPNETEIEWRRLCGYWNKNRAFCVQRVSGGDICCIVPILQEESLRTYYEFAIDPRIGQIARQKYEEFDRGVMLFIQDAPRSRIILQYTHQVEIQIASPGSAPFGRTRMIQRFLIDSAIDQYDPDLEYVAVFFPEEAIYSPSPFGAVFRVPILDTRPMNRFALIDNIIYL